jgi:cystathionine gamma-synthase
MPLAKAYVTGKCISKWPNIYINIYRYGVLNLSPGGWRTYIDLANFRFPYTDTLKILQKFGPGCIFYGLGEEKDIDDLEARLEGGERYLALFCECPSNPLLKTPNLRRLRALADTYDFLIVIDETIGNFSNIAVLEVSDIVVSSLTKVFSGDSNVMGGR